MNPDLLNNADVQTVARGAMAVVDTLQSMQPHVQIAALSACYLLLCERQGQNPTTAFSVLTNLMNYADSRRPEFRAVAMYMEHEL